jgi:hypothetical protein
MLLAQTAAGLSLSMVAPDEAAVTREVTLDSTLSIYAATERDLLGSHTLEKATLSTGARSATYSLLGLPLPGAQDLPLSQNGATLTVPEHGLTLGLPALWRRALDELVMMPRSITQTPQQLFQSAISTAQSGTHSGCDAVETVLCSGVMAPCTGKLLAPCTTASPTAASSLTAALADPPAGLDFFLSQILTLEDPSGTLEAQSIDGGQVSARSALATGNLSLSGTATGTRKTN